jgi:hypothetical protein
MGNRSRSINIGDGPTDSINSFLYLLVAQSENSNQILIRTRHRG